VVKVAEACVAHQEGGLRLAEAKNELTRWSITSSSWPLRKEARACRGLVSELHSAEPAPIGAPVIPSCLLHQLPQEAAVPWTRSRSMKRRGLLVVTLFTLVLTGIVLPQTARLNAKAVRTSAARKAESRDVLAGDAAWRWRHGQPTHWRA